MRGNQSIASVLKRVSLTYGVAVSGFVCVGLGVLSAISLRSAHEGLCALSIAKADAVLAPIARELMLGNAEQANDLFEMFNQSLSLAARSNDTALILSSSSESFARPCTSSVFFTRLNIPLTFSRKSYGRISGTLSYVPWKFGLALFLGLVFLISVSLQVFYFAIVRRIRSSILAPVSNLSQGLELSDLEQLTVASEVIAIHGNIRKLKEEIEFAEGERVRLKGQEELGRLSLQVAHDIRSPLSALKMAFSSSSSSPERIEVVHQAIQRIEEIANDLLGRSPILKSVSTADVATLMNEIIREKRTELAMRPELTLGLVSAEEFSCAIPMRKSDLKRVMSNLINNAAEAIAGPGQIKIYLEKMQSKLRISIEDNGPGMSQQLINAISQGPITQGKTTGNGLGLSHARIATESVGGEFLILSRLGHGTKVILMIPVQ